MKYRARLLWDAQLLGDAFVEFETGGDDVIEAQVDLGDDAVLALAEANRRFSEEFGVPLNPSGPFARATRLGLLLEPVGV